ncbi:MAG: hypothetical protein ACRC37_03120, partial [Lentisphaeria bacterium]
IAGSFTDFNILSPSAPSIADNTLANSKIKISNQLTVALTKLNKINISFNNFIANNPALLENFSQILYSTESINKPNLNLDFIIPITKPTEFSCKGNLFIPKRSTPLLVWDNFFASFSATKNSISIDKIAAYLPHNQNLEITAEYKFDSKFLSLNSSAFISPATILKPIASLFPEIAQNLPIDKTQNDPININLNLPLQKIVSIPTLSATISAEKIKLFDHLVVSEFSSILNLNDKFLDFEVFNGTFNEKSSAVCKGKYLFDIDELFINGLVTGAPNFAENFIFSPTAKNNFNKICSMFTWQPHSPPITNFTLRVSEKTFQVIGDVQANNLSIYNNDVQSLSAQITFHSGFDDELYLVINNLQLINDKQQSVVARGTYHFPDHREYGYIRFDGESTIPPQLLIAYFGAELSFLKNINFGNLLHYKGKGYIDLDSPELCNFSFDTNIDELSYDNFSAKNVTGSIAMKNNVVSINNYSSSYLDSNITGNLNYNLNNDQISYDVMIKSPNNLSAKSTGSINFSPNQKPNSIKLTLQSTITPQKLASYLKIKPQLLDELIFNDNISYDLNGFIDFNNPALNNISGNLAAKKSQYKKVAMQDINCSIAMKNNSIHIDKFQSNFAQGKLQGSLTYQINQNLATLNLSLFDAAMDQLPFIDNPPKATINTYISTNISFQNNTPIPLFNGSGKIHLTEGDFWKVPIISALNSLLQKILPIKNFGNITSISSNLDFQNNTIKLVNLKTDGDLIAFNGNGSVILDKKLVDITLEMKPLKNVLWNTLGFILSPITKTILINLSGPYDDLKWSPAAGWSQ